MRFFKSRLGVLALKREVIPDDDMVPIRQKCAEAIIHCIQKVTQIDVDTATEVVELLRNATDLDVDHTAVIMTEIDARLCVIDVDQAVCKVRLLSQNAT